MWQKWRCVKCKRTWSTRVRKGYLDMTMRCSCGGAIARVGKPHSSKPVPKYVQWTDQVGRRSLNRRSGITKARHKLKQDRDFARMMLKKFPNLKKRIIEEEVSSFSESFDSSYLRRDYMLTLYADVLDVQNPDDLEYVTGLPYNIKMRYTLTNYAWGSRAKSSSKNCGLLMTAGWIRVSGAAGRPISTGAAMGRHYNKKTNYPAWRHAGYPDYANDAKASAEWCHLIADSLGGPTSATNLVAASYSANTYMAAIEGCLNGKTGAEIRVLVYGKKTHIAEHITYMARTKKGSVSFEIDARCTAFSNDDADRVRKHVNDSLGL